MQDPNEQCDDHNTDNGDGCNRRCQKSSLYDCPTWGAPCVLRAVCGDGMLASNEACDDGNHDPNDGCSADCHMVEGGYRCPAPGRRCVPDCGDGRLTGTEQCDDGNTDNADGCSATCLLEFGADCPTPGQKCRLSVCGNGTLEKGESCDAGPLNGLFLGDGTGCSKTCTKEPSCRSAAGVTQACAVTCGNGNVEMGEECDDGNLGDNDGCSSTCRSETGFMCENMARPDTEPCTGGTQCLKLPVIFRDFKSEHETGGHPDFFYLGTPVTPAVQITNPAGSTHGTVTWNRRYCVPNSGGPAKQNDSTARCWDIAQANLNASGKPVFNAARAGGNTCACQFTDWSHDTNGGHVPGYTNATNGPLYLLPYVGGSNGHPLYRGVAPIVRDAASFAQWFTDSTASARTVGTLELVANAAGQYQFSSGPHAVYMGFFPIDPANHGYPIEGSNMGPGLATTVPGTNEPLLCNLWPYWFSSATFGNGAGCKGDQYIAPPSVSIPPQGQWVTGIQGWRHNFWYTTEARYLFTFNGAFELQFYGDDDLFIYINGKLVLDLGGVHQRLPGRVQVSQTGMATIVEGGSLVAGAIVPCPGMDPITMQMTNATCAGGTCDCRTRALDLGLATGRTYEIAVFHADRHPTESNYQLTLSGFQTNRTSCVDRCGNGVVRGAEECDEGAMNADGVYGGCTTACQYGPYCGDGTTNGPEECDLGSARNTTVYGSKDGCSPACTWPHYCGDGNLDDGEGEECDLGANNGMTVGGMPPTCSTQCQFLVN